MRIVVNILLGLILGMCVYHIFHGHPRANWILMADFLGAMCAGGALLWSAFNSFYDWIEGIYNDMVDDKF